MPFEDDLGEALRRAGDGFTVDGRDLVDAGERRGRRMVARRRVALVGGSALALAVIAGAGAYAGGLIGPGNGSGPSNVAAVPTPSGPPSSGQPDNEAMKKRIGTGSGAVTGEQLIAVFKQLLPGGEVSGVTARGTGEPEGPMVNGVFDDGKGLGAVGVSLTRVDPLSQSAGQMVACPVKAVIAYDDCTSEKLADGSTLMLSQGYVYSDRRADTKKWRATLLTPQGYLVDVHEHNAAAEKGKPVTRSTPPLTLAQLKAFTTSPLWVPALKDLPAADPQPADPPVAGPRAAVALKELLSGYAIPVIRTEEYDAQLGYLLLDDGKGGSLAALQIQPDNAQHPGMWAELFRDAQTLPDGTKIVTRQKRGETAGAVDWSVEVLRTNGTRVIVSSYNTTTLKGTPTRKEPALSMDRLKEIATSPKWAGYGY